MKFYGQFTPPVDQFLYERYFRNKEDGVAIECGAFDGQTESSCKFFEESMGWRLVNIEASPPIFKSLVENRTDSENYNIALSDKRGTSVFTHVISPIFGEHFSNGSLSHLDSHRDELTSDGCQFVEYEVATTTYKDFIDATNLSRLDLMVLDVEGHELSVIDGMIGAKILPDIFCIEHGHLGVERLKSALSEFPYKFDTSLHVNSFFIRI